MLRIIYLVTLLLALSACSSVNEMTEEEGMALRDKLDNDTSRLVSTAVTPIFNLIGASIIHYEEKGEWPVFSVIPGKKSYFRNYQVVDASKDKFTSKFQLKSTKFDWELELERTGRREDEKKLYLVNLTGTGSGKSVVADIKGLKATRSMSVTAYEKKKAFARMLAVMVDFSGRLPEKKNELGDGMAVIKTVPIMALGMTFCAIFNVAPDQCSMGVRYKSDKGERRRMQSKLLEMIDGHSKLKLKRMENRD